MERINKGISIGKHIEDYCVVDLETTGTYQYMSAPKIIEISALKVRGNEVVDTYSKLVNPHCHIPDEAAKINHITDDMVSVMPCLDEIIDEFISFLGEDVIVGYNNASFDNNVIYDSLFELRGIHFSNNYLDVLHVAQRCFDKSVVADYKLETISHYYSLDTTGEHRALKDCYLTKECYDKIYEEFGDNPFAVRYENRNSYIPRYSDETLEMKKLQGVLNTILRDDYISDEEISKLKIWINEHDTLRGNFQFDNIKNIVDDIINDGQRIEYKIEELVKAADEIVNPLTRILSHDEIQNVQDKHICLTGDFDHGDRDTIFELIERAGGIIDNNTKKTTDYVVVGAKGSDSWKMGNYGSKIQKAIEFNNKGAVIKIVEEADFIPVLLSANGNNEVDSDVDWKAKINRICSDLIMEYELPEGTVYLAENRGKKNTDEIKSYSICIWEPQYPLGEKNYIERNDSVLNIKEKKGCLELNLLNRQYHYSISLFPYDAYVMDLSKTDKDNNRVRICIREDSSGFNEYIKKNIEYCIENYKSKASPFGCCSLFEKCSEAKKCLHKNKLYSKGCMYRKNLEQGNIFYGIRKSDSDITGKTEVKRQKLDMGDSVLILETNKDYSGAKELSEEEKQVRRALGLPVTKQLVYYRDKRDAKSIININSYRIIEMYEITDRWYTMEIKTAEDRTYIINSMYLTEMQKPSFIADMASQAV